MLVCQFLLFTYTPPVPKFRHLCPPPLPICQLLCLFISYYPCLSVAMFRCQLLCMYVSCYACLSVTILVCQLLFLIVSCHACMSVNCYACLSFATIGCLLLCFLSAAMLVSCYATGDSIQPTGWPTRLRVIPSPHNCYISCIHHIMKRSVTASMVLRRR